MNLSPLFKNDSAYNHIKLFQAFKARSDGDPKTLYFIALTDTNQCAMVKNLPMFIRLFSGFLKKKLDDLRDRIIHAIFMIDGKVGFMFDDASSPSEAHSFIAEYCIWDTPLFVQRREFLKKRINAWLADDFGHRDILENPKALERIDDIITDVAAYKAPLACREEQLELVYERVVCSNIFPVQCRNDAQKKAVPVGRPVEDTSIDHGSTTATLTVAEKNWQRVIKRQIKFDRANKEKTAKNKLESEKRLCVRAAAEAARAAKPPKPYSQPGRSGPAPKAAFVAQEVPGESARCKKRGESAIAKEKILAHRHALVEKEEMRRAQEDEKRYWRRKAFEIGGH